MPRIKDDAANIDKCDNAPKFKYPTIHVIRIAENPMRTCGLCFLNYCIVSNLRVITYIAYISFPVSKSMTKNAISQNVILNRKIFVYTKNNE